MINVPIPEILPEELDLNENCKYAIGPKTLSIMGKLNGRIVTVKKYQQTIPDSEISQLLNNEYETIRFVRGICCLTWDLQHNVCCIKRLAKLLTSVIHLRPKRGNC